MNLSIPKSVDLATLKQDIAKARRKQTLYYYKEHYALDAKAILDKLHTANNAIRVLKGEMSLLTIRSQYYQGAKYLLDNLDPDGRYAALYARTKCVVYNDYLEFHVKRGGISIQQVIIPWRDEFVYFIENAVKDDKFYKNNLVLTSEDKSWIEAQLAPLVKTNGSPLFFGQIENNSILLIRDEN